MRTQVTFIMRMWFDPDAIAPLWEGQVEEVGSGERAHVRGPDELARFIAAQTRVAQARDLPAREEEEENGENP